MSIENIMYFVLGALASGLVMLMFMPAIWRRAVRLTRKRIEAATPITLAEFRADKDQLRAQFALSTRRLEMHVEQLRERLAEELGGASASRQDLVSLRRARDDQAGVARELEEREAVLRERILDLERESAELSQRLARRERELETKSHQLENAREAIRLKLPPDTRVDGTALTGNYDEDVDELLTSLAIERKRAGALEQQARDLLAELQGPERRSAETTAAVVELRRSLGGKNGRMAGANQNLVEAEVRMANAETRLNALLAETSPTPAGGTPKREPLLAEKLSLEAQVEQLRQKVLGVETSVLAGWGTGRAEPTQLQERLDEIASDVSRMVYAVEAQPAPDVEESLFDRVQRFASDGVQVEEFPVSVGGVHPEGRGAIGARPAARAAGGSVADRMVALRELQGRN